MRANSDQRPALLPMETPCTKTVLVEYVISIELYILLYGDIILHITPSKLLEKKKDTIVSFKKNLRLKDTDKSKGSRGMLHMYVCCMNKRT